MIPDEAGNIVVMCYLCGMVPICEMCGWLCFHLFGSERSLWTSPVSFV